MFDPKQNRPLPGTSWIWLTIEMMKSDAWRSLGINQRRVVDFLLVEFMRKGGANNGMILAPYRQLEQIGITARLISGAIDRVEEVGLIEVHRGGRRVANSYTLAWLPSHDGRSPSNRWREFHCPMLQPWPEPEKIHA